MLVLYWAIYAAAAGVAIVFADALLDAVAGSSESFLRLAAFRVTLLVGLGAPVVLTLLRRRLGRPPAVKSVGALPAWLSPFPALLALSVAAAVGGLLTFDLGKSAVSRTVTHHLEAITKLKAHLIESWVHETGEDIAFFVNTPHFAETLHRWRARGMHEDESRTSLLEAMSSMRTTGHYLDMSLRDADSGALLLTTGTESDDGWVRSQAVAAARSGARLFEDFHAESERGALIYVGFFVPVTEPGASQPGVVMHVAVEPAHSLFPLLQEWAGAAPSAELMLMRRDGDDFVMLNALRNRPHPALLMRVPIAQPGFFAAPLVQGPGGALEGLDDDNTPVFAHGAAIAGMPWFVVAKVDRAEAYAELVAISLLAAGLVGGLLLAGAWWWVEQHRHFAAAMRLQVERNLLSDRISFLARFANDCIVRCDAYGNILEVNDRCLTTYGYSLAEMLAMNVAELRAPATRLEAGEMLRELGEQGSLVYETEHRRKDGRLFPVEVSARLIEIDGQRGMQAIIRDISERKAAEAQILGLTRLHATISAVNQAIVRGRDLDDVSVQVCKACVEHGRFRMAWVGLAEPLTGAIACRASSGEGVAYLEEASLSTDSGARERREPAVTALRDQRVFVCNDLAAYALAEPWRLAASRHGFRAAIALPLHNNGETIGVLTAYSAETNSFGDEAVALLGEMAQNLSFAFQHFAHERLRVEAESALRRSEARLKQAQVVGKIGDWSFDRRTGRLTGSAEARRMLGIAPEGADAASALANYPAAAGKVIRGALRRVLRTRQRVEVEVPLANADGSQAVHAAVMIPEQPDRGRIVRVYGTVQDITERRRLEAERSKHLRRLAELSHRVVSVQEDERRRLSRDLHDRTGANLASVSLNLSTIDDCLPPSATASRDLLEETRGLLAETIVNIREFCADLRPAVLDYAGLVPALESLASQFQLHTGTAVAVTHEKFGARCTAEVESLLFRIAQEALTNCAKHANASAVGIHLENSGSRCTMTIVDDGRGFDPDSLGRPGGSVGQGLLNMRERAELAGGRFHLSTRPGRGTTIEIEFAGSPGGASGSPEPTTRDNDRSRSAHAFAGPVLPAGKRRSP